MALSLESYQAVEMNGKAFVPTITTELTMKLRETSLDTEANRDEAVDVMAECFAGHASEVKKFLKNCPAPVLARLQAYLIAGDDGVKMVDSRLAKVAEDAATETAKKLAESEE